MNSLWFSAAIWQQRSGLTLAQMTVCCLTAPSHCLNQYWRIISGVVWYDYWHPSASSQKSLHWRYNDHDGVSNHQPYGCLLNRLFRRRSKKTSKLRVTGLCVGNSPGPVNFPHKGPVTQKNVSIWWRHHVHTIWQQQKIFPFDDVIMCIRYGSRYYYLKWSSKDFMYLPGGRGGNE